MVEAQVREENLADSRERWYSLATQVDWSGPIMQESWYGHRNPCRRIAVWVHFSSFVRTFVVAYHAFSHWPILYPYITLTDLNQIQQSHSDCLISICDSLEDVEFTCQMKGNGEIVMIDPFPAEDIIPLSQECHNAIDMTFGKGAEKQLKGPIHEANLKEHQESTEDTNSQLLDLIHFGKADENRIPLFEIDPNECLADGRLLEHLVFGDMLGSQTSMAFLIDMVESFSMQPGEKNTIFLRSYVCPQYMSEQTRDEILPKMQQVYNLFLIWRRSFGFGLIYWIQIAYYCATCAARTIFLLVPTSLIWFALPRKEIRGHRITFFHAISTLLLLSVLSQEGDGSIAETIRTLALVSTSIYFGNSKAALEWLFFYMLSFMRIGEIEVPISMNYITTPLGIDGVVNLTEEVNMLLSSFIPGRGLWKIVSIYVLYMSFPRL